MLFHTTCMYSTVGDILPVVCWGKTAGKISHKSQQEGDDLCSVLGSSAWQTWTYWRVQPRATKLIKGLEQLTQAKAGKLGLVTPGKRRLRGSSLMYINSKGLQRTVRLFSGIPRDKTRAQKETQEVPSEPHKALFYCEGWGCGGCVLGDNQTWMFQWQFG